MANNDDIVRDPREMVIDRRGFLVASGLAAIGLTYPEPAPAASQCECVIYKAVTKLAQAINSRSVSQRITDYVRRSEVSRATETEVDRTNRKMARDPIGRFTDLSMSTVYVPEAHYFFYPVRSEDRVNTCAAFFDTTRNQGSQGISLIEGPTLFGIGEAAERLAQERSALYAKRVFLPRDRISNGTGAWRISYSQPDIYRTDAGTVYASYRTNGESNGIVTVKAKDLKGELLASGDYSLTFG